jgi:hypothetical protein
MFLPLPDENPTFPAEEARLLSLGLAGKLIDVRGDGNCLYYCMLNYLVETKELTEFWNQNENPVDFLQRLLRDSGSHLKESYWMFLAGVTEPKVRLDWLYNKRINYMDEKFMLEPGNEDYMGDQFDCCLFAKTFRVRVVSYSLETDQSFTTQLYDGREYNATTGTDYCLLPVTASNLPVFPLVPLYFRWLDIQQTLEII